MWRPLAAFGGAGYAGAALFLLVAGPLGAQRGTTPAGSPPSTACWNFSFGEWTPPLDWSGSGHRGDSASADARVRRARDSLFVHDSAARESNAMEWTRTEKGWEVLLFPNWWPAGVVVRFDGNPTDSAEARGEATALLGDPNREPSKAKVRAVARKCGDLAWHPVSPYRVNHEATHPEPRRGTGRHRMRFARFARR